MVKTRPGSRKGRTRFVPSAYKAAKKRASRLGQSSTPKRSVINETVRKAWDARATPSTNLKRLGLQSKINKVRKSAVTTKRIIHMKDDAELDGGHDADFHMAADDDIYKQARESLDLHASLPEQRAKQVVRPGEQLALQRMVDKHGDDWVEMARDVKLNYLQWTPSQLQKKVERMQSLTKSKQ